MELTKTVYLLSLGCAKNLVDSEVMLGVLAQAGCRFTRSSRDANIIIVNTCAFIDDAVREAAAAIRSLARCKRTGRCSRLIVCGCLPQRFVDELPSRFPEVDLFLGTGEVPLIARRIEQLDTGSRITRVRCNRPTYLLSDRAPRVLATEPGSAYLKIAEGCSNACTYCTIPAIRGPYRFRDQDSILREARRLVREHGVREVNLIAQDTTRYPDLAALLRRLARIPKLRWIRLLYGHPLHLTTDILTVIAQEETICRYLDLPVQHISDPVLRRMGRRMTGRAVRTVLDRVRRIVPDIALRTTLMVGFPGESDRAFQELAAFVRDARFDHLGVFAYRDEPGTAAAWLFPKVPEAVKEERCRELLRLQARIARDNNRRRVGSVCDVLVTGPAQRRGYALQGRAWFQAPEVDGVVLLKKSAPVGEIAPVAFTGARTYDLVGDLIGH